MSNLDAILDQALDDFEEMELADKADKLAKEKEGRESNESNTNNDHVTESEEEKVKAMEHMQNLISELNNPNYGETLQTTLKSLSQTKEGGAQVDDFFKGLENDFQMNHQPSFLPNGPDDVEGIQGADREVAATLQKLAQQSKDMQGMHAGKMEDVGETMMEDMMNQFQALGDKEDYHEVVDGVMRQLLSKDLMYEPMQQICEKYPEWLALHKKNLREKEYENYGKQYQVFQKLLAVYDTEPDNFPRLMELMFDMQQYGQPPADIIRDLAPGLKFDENGMPIMPNMGTGMMPEMPGGDGLPNMAEMAGQMATGQCTIC